VVVVRQRLRKRVFKALKEGFKAGYKSKKNVPVEAKDVQRPTLAAMEGEESVQEFVDGGLRTGKIPTEKWSLEEGKLE
jgi:hypothetical protein